jgi:hypothetical protein
MNRNRHLSTLVVFCILLAPSRILLTLPSKEIMWQSFQHPEDSNVSSSAQQNKSNPSVERANTIINKSLMAYGGEAKILSRKDLTYEYLVETVDGTTSKPITMRTFFKDDSYFRSEVMGDSLSALTILSGDKGWVKVGDTTLSLARKEIDPVKSGMIAQLRPDLLLLIFAKRRYTGSIEENDHNLDQVEISGFVDAEYVRGRLSFDVNTALIYKYEYEIERDLAKGKGIVRGEERYLQYKENDGFKFPVEIISRQGRKASRLSVRRVDFSSVLNERLFQDPSADTANSK